MASNRDPRHCCRFKRAKSVLSRSGHCLKEVNKEMCEEIINYMEGALGEQGKLPHAGDMQGTDTGLAALASAKKKGRGQVSEGNSEDAKDLERQERSELGDSSLSGSHPLTAAKKKRSASARKSHSDVKRARKSASQVRHQSMPFIMSARQRPDR